MHIFTAIAYVHCLAPRSLLVDEFVSSIFILESRILSEEVIHDGIRSLSQRNVERSQVQGHVYNIVLPTINPS